MNVRGVFLYGLSEHGIDKANNRSVVVAFQQIGRLKFICNLTEVEVLIKSVDHLRRIGSVAFVGLLKQRIEGLCRDARQRQRHARKSSCFDQAQ